MEGKEGGEGEEGKEEKQEEKEQERKGGQMREEDDEMHIGTNTHLLTSETTDLAKNINIS